MLKLVPIIISIFFAIPTFANTPCALTTAEIQTIENHISPKPTTTCSGHTLTINSATTENFQITTPNTLFEEEHRFNGLAVLYNGSQPVQFNADKTVEYLLLPQEIKTTNEWIGKKGRFKIFMIHAPNAIMNFTEENITLQWQPNTPINFQIYLGEAQDQFEPIRFSNLWNWLAFMCRVFENILIFLHGLLGSNWGIAIIALAILIKVIMLPLSLLMQKYQREVSRCQTLLEPKLKEIKAKYDGEEAHNRIMAEYKALGITPFYTLKPMISLFIQIPILVVVSNILGEMPELAGQSFLWIKDLAYPDTLAHLPFMLPLFGNEFNLLPFLMALVTFLATVLFQNRHAPPGSVQRQKYSLYLMVAAFFILFYPFPAALVLFWTLTNLLQGIQQQLIKL